MDFITIDFETADRANSAPCEMSIVLVENGQITEEKTYRINPECEFSPFAMRVHKITPDDVADEPIFPEIWEQIKKYFEKYPVYAHNASFDLSVLQKVADKYQIQLPPIQGYCTYTTIKDIYPNIGGKLDEICEAFNIPLEKHHSSLCDARACAHIVLRLENGNQPCAEYNDIKFKAEKDLNASSLGEFEIKCLKVISEMFPESELRYVNSNKLALYTNPWAFMSIGNLKKKGYFVPTSRDLSPYQDILICDCTAKCNRIFISEPNDLYKIKDLLTSKYHKSEKTWNEYQSSVKENTWRRHWNEYVKSSYPAAYAINKIEE